MFVKKGQGDDVNMQVFRFNGDSLKSIYKKQEDKEEDGDSISGHLEDGHTVVIEYQPTGFKKEKNYWSLDIQKNGCRAFREKKSKYTRHLI